MEKWILWGVTTFIMLVIFWPLGLFMLFVTPILVLIAIAREGKTREEKDA